MQYVIELRPKALKDLKQLSPEVSRRIMSKIEMMTDGLSGDVKRLVKHQPGWRLRVGDWRVLFEVTGHTIVVYRVVHRSAAYQ